LRTWIVNLAVAVLLEGVRERVRTVELKQVNPVLLQPHWRKESDLAPILA
jgi:hypothetical protein